MYAWMCVDSSSSDGMVILIVREEGSWIESVVRHCIHRMVYDPRLRLCHRQRRGKWSTSWIPSLVPLDLLTSSPPMVLRKRYLIHNHRVTSIVPADKLLVYNLKRGWKPLCDFLECEVPTVTFPRENIEAEITKTLPRWNRKSRELFSSRNYCSSNFGILFKSLNVTSE